MKVKGEKAGQLKWLKDDLKAASELGCMVAFWHPFRFSSGLHGHNDSEDRTVEVKLGSSMERAYRLLYEHGATLILTGHDHSFEQFGRQDSAGKKREDGIRSFVVGTGGGGLYNTISKGKKIRESHSSTTRRLRTAKSTGMTAMVF